MESLRSIRCHMLTLRQMASPGFHLSDLGAFAGDILLLRHRFNAQKIIKISRKGAEAPRRNSRKGLPLIEGGNILSAPGLSFDGSSAREDLGETIHGLLAASRQSPMSKPGAGHD